MTAARKLDSDLDSNTKLFEQLSKTLPAVEISLDEKLLQVNEQFAKALSYSVEDLKGKKFKDLLNPEFLNSSEFQAHWTAVKNSSEKSPMYFRFSSVNNRDIWFIGNLSSYTNQDSTQSIYFTGVDVSELKTELQIRIDIMNQTSIVSEANLRGDIMSVNDKFIEISKYSKDELIGKPHNTTRHPDMPKEVFKEMWATIGKGRIFRGIVKNRAKDELPIMLTL